MASRPYINCGIEDLEKLVEGNQNSADVLRHVLAELEHRKQRKRNLTLKKKAEAMLDGPEIQKPTTSATETTPADPKPNIQLKAAEPLAIKKYPSGAEWDKKQRTVIEVSEDAYQLVEAGPGTGKTGVACARVAYLVDEYDIEPAKILLVSFTRAAVKEIRDRIKAAATDTSRIDNVQIITLDALSWQINKGLNQSEHQDVLLSYENNIEKFLDALRDQEPFLLSYLSEIEHLIIDEAQDVVSRRADLVLEIIRNVSDHCGVTMLADSAQAIYGFTSDSNGVGDPSSQTVVERINGGELHGFAVEVLEEVYRTDDPGLVGLFHHGRKTLLGRRSGDLPSWNRMRDLITTSSQGSVGNITEQDLAGRDDTLVLYRMRAEVLLASSFLWSQHIPHKIRMSGTAVRLKPQLAAILGQYTGDIISRADFLEKAAEVMTADAGGEEQLWELLYRLAGTSRNRLKLNLLRDQTGREKPPIELLQDESELAGPVIGTIHASKGRESSRVHLMVPEEGFISYIGEKSGESRDYALLEEERVLFVGATRARDALFSGTGYQSYASRLSSGRVIRKSGRDKSAAQIEVGIAGDIDEVSLADSTLDADPQELQQWLFAHASTKVDCLIELDFDSNRRILRERSSGRAIAAMSSQFDRDLWLLADKLDLNRKSVTPQVKIPNVHMLGATTTVVPASDRDALLPPWRHSAFLLVPVVSGFQKIKFYKRRQG
jgi:hypothetical protein